MQFWLSALVSSVAAEADAQGLHLLQLHSFSKDKSIVSVSQSVGGPGEDAAKFCNTEALVLNEPTESNLDGSGPGPKLVRYPSVKDGVDMILEAGDDYVAKDSSQNGLKNGFGNLNMKAGTRTDHKFTFVAAGTTEPVVVPKVSITFYDMDEGKRGRGRGTVESCETAASFIPAHTELAQQKKGDCVKTSTCVRGKKKNEPPTPLALDNDHLKRAMTMSYEGKSSFTIRLGLSPGKGGRNFMFAMTAMGACRLTTTTTTEPIPTTQPVPHCPAPKGPYKTCDCQQDPSCMNSFLAGDVTFFHHGFGVFWAARTSNGDGVQVFHAPYFGTNLRVGIIAGIAVKIGDDIITYTPTSFADNSGTPKIVLNGKETFGADAVKQKMKRGYAVSVPQNSPGHTMAYSKEDIEGVCMGDDDGNFQVAISKRANFGAVEFHWKVNMHEDAMDTSITNGRYGQICMDGPEIWHGRNVLGNESSYDIGRVMYNESFFAYKEMDEICGHLMTVAGGCNEAQNQLVDKKHEVWTNEDLCDATNTSWADAQTACSGIQKVFFKNACLFEYCNDKAPPNAPELGEEMEEDMEAARAGADESHENELNFVADKCCLDDADCEEM